MQKEKKGIVVIGSSNTDMVIRSERLPRPGETILGGRFMMNPGGKGANQAVAAARLGGDVVFICKVGDDIFGAETLKILKEENIDTTYVTIAKEAPSGVALINVDAKAENCIAVAPGANACLSPADVDDAREAIKKASAVVMQLETPLKTICHAAKVAKEEGALVMLNPAPAPSQPLPDELLANVDLLLPNLTETEILTGMEITDDNSALAAAEKLAAKGVKTIIITLGSRGALAVHDGESFFVPAFKVEAVDTTAAGDTFCGALCVALSEGKTLKEAITFGCKASSISVTRLGAQSSVPYRREIDI